MAEQLAPATPLVGTGRFVWHDLMSRDVAVAERFYTQLLGWTAQTRQFGDMPYTIFEAAGTHIAGLASLPPGDMPSYWLGYASVTDVDATVALVEQHHGQVYVPGTDLPTVGRFAVTADPQGAVFSPFRFIEADGPAADGMPVGHFCWDTLMTTDMEAAIAFYTTVLGWEKQEGPMTLFVKGETQIANIEAAQPGMPAAWLSYVFVADLAATRDQVESLGGKVLMPYVAVPGIGAFAVIQDPTGAVLGLFGNPIQHR